MSSSDYQSGGKVTKFDKGAYTRLTKFVDATNSDLDRFLHPSGEITLDSTLADRIKPGSAKDWPSGAGAVVEASKAFGGSVNEQMAGQSKDWTQYTTQLNKAAKVFEDTNDLATMTATDMQAKYPGLGGNGGGTTK